MRGERQSQKRSRQDQSLAAFCCFAQLAHSKKIVILRLEKRTSKLKAMDSQVVLNKIIERAKEILPEDARLVLFGSRARGDARPDSDWDLLIVLNKDQRSIDDIAEYGCPFMELGYDIDEEINPLVYTKSDWKRNHFTLFHHFVEDEGIELCH